MTTPNEIPTPRTDAVLIKEITCTEGGEHECKVYPSWEIVDADFARTLERETIAQAKRIEELERTMADIRTWMLAEKDRETRWDSNGMRDGPNPYVSELCRFLGAINRALLNRQP